MICPLSLPIPLNLSDQSRHEPLPLRRRWRQIVDELPGLLGERGLPLASQRFTGGVPSAFKFWACLP
jgi:hypothetical protein